MWDLSKQQTGKWNINLPGNKLSIQTTGDGLAAMRLAHFTGQIHTLWQQVNFFSFVGHMPTHCGT